MIGGNKVRFATVGIYNLAMKTRIFLIVTFVLFVLGLSLAYAEEYYYSKDNTVIGSPETHTVKEGESLIEIAREFGVGYNEIAAANPDLDPFIPGTDVSVLIPTSWILPDVKTYQGMVINISEMRLYYFLKKGSSSIVMTFPIGIGSEGNDTPTGHFTVVQKIINPPWHVPESIRKERPELPKVVPPGPENPLGSHALRLSLGTVLLHGTNRPFGVGRRVSHGCIRLYPEDIPRLYHSAFIGTKVTIVRQPVKVGIKNGGVYVEVHDDEKQRDINYLNNEAFRLLKKKGLLKRVSTEKLYRVLEERRGMPVDISE